MAIVFHTKDEIIPVSSLSERWSIDDIGLIRTIVYEKFNIFFATDIRETETITYFVGHCFTYEKDYDSIGRAAQELFSGVLGAGPEAEEGEAFLLKKDVLEYEKANPYLLSKPIAPGTWQEHMQVFKDALPVPALNGGHSEQLAQAQARVSELERQLAQAQGEIARLKEERAQEQARAEGQEAALALPRYGAIKFVDDCYRAGLTPEQTAQELGRHGYKGPAICALLHPDVVGDGAKSITDQAQYGRDLKAGRVKGKKAW